MDETAFEAVLGKPIAGYLPSTVMIRRNAFERVGPFVEDKRVGELMGKMHGPERVKDEKQLEAIQEEYSELSERAWELRTELPVECESHGWVWLFVRK